MSQTTAPPTRSAGLDAGGTPQGSHVGESFWQVARRSFWRRIANRIACGWILTIAIVAVVVPFIANGQPYTIEMKQADGTWIREFPLFASLNRLDISLFVIAAAIVTYIIIYRRSARILERDERIEWATLAFLGTLVISAGVIWGIGLLSAAPGLISIFRIGWLSDVPRQRAMLYFLTVAVTLLPCAIWFWRLRKSETPGLHFITPKRLALGWVMLMTAVGVGMAIDPGKSLTPYDFRAYEQMQKEGSARGAVFAPIKWHYADQEPLIANRVYEFPSADHWLGTDGVGRDALSRLLWSMRVVMGISFIAEVIALAIGILVGALIGYFRGTTDLLGMRLVEIFESIPTFILILIFVASYGRDIFMIMVILGLTGWTGIARFVRAEFLSLRNRDFVHAANALGLPLRRVLFKHMLPNGLTPVIVTVTFGVAGATMSESGLSFLGVGVEPPTPSWGSMLNEAGNPAETFRWWLAIAPGALIFLTVFAYNIIGEGMRDAFDPKTNKME